MHVDASESYVDINDNYIEVELPACPNYHGWQAPGTDEWTSNLCVTIGADPIDMSYSYLPDGTNQRNLVAFFELGQQEFLYFQHWYRDGEGAEPQINIHEIVIDENGYFQLPTDPGFPLVIATEAGMVDYGVWDPTTIRRGPVRSF